MVLLTFLIKFTRIGKAMRATAQDKDMAMLVGVDVNRVISVTFIVGSATAALGGVLIASHIGQINFYIGFIAGIKAFVAAVLGGIGSIPGAVLGSMVLGMDRKLFHRLHLQRLRGCVRLSLSGVDPDFQAGRHSGPKRHRQGVTSLRDVTERGNQLRSSS
jgi:branched-subunit amino acid ABC-type transport system permease component